MTKIKLIAGIATVVCLLVCPIPCVVSSALSQQSPQQSTQNITQAVVFPVAKPGEDEGALLLAERCLVYETGRDDREDWWKLTNNCLSPKPEGAKGTIVHIQEALTYSDGSVIVGHLHLIDNPAQVHISESLRVWESESRGVGSGCL
jgi:hypothetical protein